jgi:predicted signal transduction protein with EAL and GGDEF domain
VTISAVRDQNGKISHTFSLFSDISVHKDAEARMQRMANYDPLTGLPNLCLLSQLVEQALTESKRSGEQGALMVIEISAWARSATRWAMRSARAAVRNRPHVPCFAARGRRAGAAGGHRFAIARCTKARARRHRRQEAGRAGGADCDRLAQPAGGRIIGIFVQRGWLDVPTLIRCADVAVAKAAQSIESNFLFYSEEMNQRAKEHLRIERSCGRP